MTGAFGVRKSPILLLVHVLILTGLLAACGSSTKTASSSVDNPATLTLAISSVEGSQQLQKQFGPLQAKLTKILHMPVKLFPVADRTAAAAAIESNHLDLVMAGPAEYVALRAESGTLPVVGLSQPGYRTLWVVHGGSAITSLAQLKGKAVGLTDPGSTSGYVYPLKMLLDAGLKPGSTVTTQPLSSNQAAAFLGHKVDAVATYPAGYAALLKLGGLTPQQAPVIARSPMFPPNLIIANPRLSASLRNRIKSELSANSAAIMKSIQAAGGIYVSSYAESKIIPVTDKDFDMIRQAYRQDGYPNLAKIPS
ncbi:phosphate/phosphite/phosphonate ABC transporter substrate-binding protein [Streptomyces sp. NPDC001508]|uniref:phosphate/phosphite/phosphonate ABC transporter substrate-binding protein n=1 Tax=Streptomyces sp. NPDC001508 TaxID=3154656 RepID=UPI00332CAA30